MRFQKNPRDDVKTNDQEGDYFLASWARHPPQTKKLVKSVKCRCQFQTHKMRCVSHWLLKSKDCFKISPSKKQQNQKSPRVTKSMFRYFKMSKVTKKKHYKKEERTKTWRIAEKFALVAPWSTSWHFCSWPQGFPGEDKAPLKCGSFRGKSKHRYNLIQFIGDYWKAFGS